MAAWVWNVQITFPWGPGVEPVLEGMTALYGELLGMEPLNLGYQKLTKGHGIVPEIGFEDDGGHGDPPPQWPDPEHPQQMHLDVEVGDTEVAAARLVELGATRLATFDDHVVLADQAGHPICLYADATMASPLPGRMAAVVIDCFSPRALAAFYEELLGMHRVLDTHERVEIATNLRHLTTTAEDGSPITLTVQPVRLAFQHAVFPAARWPDPAYPEQMHLDLGFSDEGGALRTMERLGARCLTATESHSVWADPAGHPFCAAPLSYG